MLPLFFYQVRQFRGGLFGPSFFLELDRGGLLMPDWKKIKAEYIRGGVSYRKLAEKYEVSPTTLYRRMQKEKWADLRKQKEEKANAKIVESAASREANRADKIQTVADLLLEKIDEKVKSGEFLIEARDVRALTAALKDIKEIKGYKSDLDMQEQMARIEKLRRDAYEDDAKDTTITVKLEGDIEEWSK